MRIEPPMAPGGGAPRPRRRRVAAAVVVVVLGLAACGGHGDDAAGEVMTLAGSSWTLATASALDGGDLAAVGTATLAFEDGGDGTTVTGTTGCNRFSGSYRQSGDGLTIAVGPVTRAGCPGPDATAQEAAILAHLPDVASFVAARQLELRDAEGGTLLVYDEQPSTIAGTSWTATGVNNGRGGVETVAGTAALTAAFADDGTLSGFAGCNTFTATYTASGADGLAISDLATTTKVCDEAATSLEAQYVAALGAVATYELVGDTLTLRDSAGSTQATYATAG
jgi:heat shock protein HslJ